ncbi:hypothetical protein Dehly_0159 [Dehalogenimonas lykanthroporepellens BL-DC-9]|nr:hypothetical protein Dehly_0159 [Dehalogenimonas lykanthroporepellens BL-DC-9]
MNHSPILQEFILDCAERAGRNWLDLYDEMCHTAARRRFRGLGYRELMDLGLPLDLAGLDITAALVDEVLAARTSAG